MRVSSSFIDAGDLGDMQDGGWSPMTAVRSPDEDPLKLNDPENNKINLD